MCAHSSSCPSQPGGGGAGWGVVACSCSTLTLCQQVESVIAVPGEGVRARTPITNHRLPPLGSWSRIVFLEGKHSNLSELSKPIHDSEILLSPSGIFCVLVVNCCWCIYYFAPFLSQDLIILYAVRGEKELLLERRFQKWFWILYTCF